MKLNVPRKLGAMVLMAAFVLLAGFAMKPDRIPATTTALVGLYVAFAGSHAYTDAKAKRNPQDEEGS